MLADFAASLPEGAPVPPLLAGTGKDDVHLIVACHRRPRPVRRLQRQHRPRGAPQGPGAQGQGKTVKILCLGKRARDALKRQFGDAIVDTVEGLGRNVVPFSAARGIAVRIAAMFENGEFDVCTVVYNRFQSAMTQHVTPQQIIPFEAAAAEKDKEKNTAESKGPEAMYILEPEESEILEALLPRNLAVQIHHALTESYASEQGARMTAMDNATRNAGDMIDSLTLTYNRTRQAVITKELIEIVSGAEAL